MMYGDMMNGGFGFMGIFWIVLIILILGMMFSYFRNGTASRSDETEFQILRKRYARGEISKDEYREKKQFLTEN